MCIVLCVHVHMQLHVCDVYMCVRASVCILPHIKAEEAPQSINLVLARKTGRVISTYYTRICFLKASLGQSMRAKPLE